MRIFSRSYLILVYSVPDFTSTEMLSIILAAAFVSESLTVRILSIVFCIRLSPHEKSERRRMNTNNMRVIIMLS